MKSGDDGSDDGSDDGDDDDRDGGGSRGGSCGGGGDDDGDDDDDDDGWMDIIPMKGSTANLSGSSSILQVVLYVHYYTV